MPGSPQPLRLRTGFPGRAGGKDLRAGRACGKALLHRRRRRALEVRRRTHRGRRVEPTHKIYRQAEVLGVKGSCGNFLTRIAAGGKEIEISHGVAIIAVGAASTSPPNTFTARTPGSLPKRIRTMLATDPASAQTLPNIAMIQCVGSREPQTPTAAGCAARLR